MKKSLFLVALSAVLLAFGAGQASAAQYKVWTCHSGTQDRSQYADWWGFFSQYEPVEGIFDVGFEDVDEDCPNGFVFPHAKELRAGEELGIAYKPNSSDPTIENVSFDAIGGDDQYEYVVGECLRFDCRDHEEVDQFSAGGTELDPNEVTVDLGAIGPWGFVVWARCVESPCAPGSSMLVRNFEIAMSDSVAPLLGPITMEPLDLFSPPGGWTNAKWLPVSFEATDQQTGVDFADIVIDGLLATQEGGACDGATDDYYVAAMVCSPELDVDRTLDVRALLDGAHTFRTIVVDDVGNATDTGELTFGIDRTRPASPTGLKLAPPVTPDGWTTEPDFNFEFDDPRDNPVTMQHSGWKEARFDLASRNSAADAPSTTEDDPVGQHQLNFPGEGLWELGVTVIDGAGNESPTVPKLVGFDRDVPGAVILNPNGWITLDELIDGYNQTWPELDDDPQLESGICGYSIEFDDTLGTVPDDTIDLRFPATSVEAPARLRAGHHFSHVRTVACNGRVAPTATEPLNVDSAAPTPLLGNAGDSGWSNKSGPITVYGTDDLSGIASVSHSFDGAGFTTTSAQSKTVTPPEGEHELAFAATDVAGNAAPSITRTIRRDWTAPQVEFEPRELASPQTVTATITDPASGISSAAMAYRRIDGAATASEGAWKPLGQTQLPEGSDNHSLSVTRTLPDEQLAPGTYEIRVSAFDVAGNSTDDAPEPAALILGLPLRGPAVLSAAIADVGSECRTAAGKKCKAVSKCRKSQRCTRQPVIEWGGARDERAKRFGEMSALVGTLADANGNPLAGVKLAIYQRIEFASLQPLSTVTTNANGEYSLLLDNGPTRDFEVRFAGDGKWQPTEAVAALAVRAALTLKISKRTVRPGEPFVLSGRLLSGDLGLPEGQKVISFQFLRERRWVPTIDNPRVDSKGRFKGTWPGVSATKSTFAYFRAVAEKDGAWPFLTGYSKVVRVRVKT